MIIRSFSPALEKLHFQAQQPSSCGPVEVALPGLVFDLSSLVLYGAHAIPVRLKILLDRLYSILTPEQVHLDGSYDCLEQPMNKLSLTKYEKISQISLNMLNHYSIVDRLYCACVADYFLSFSGRPHTAHTGLDFGGLC